MGHSGYGSSYGIVMQYVEYELLTGTDKNNYHTVIAKRSIVIIQIICVFARFRLYLFKKIITLPFPEPLFVIAKMLINQFISLDLFYWKPPGFLSTKNMMQGEIG